MCVNKIEMHPVYLSELKCVAIVSGVWRAQGALSAVLLLLCGASVRFPVEVRLQRTLVVREMAPLKKLVEEPTMRQIARRWAPHRLVTGWEYSVCEGRAVKSMFAEDVMGPGACACAGYCTILDVPVLLKPVLGGTEMCLQKTVCVPADGREVREVVVVNTLSSRLEVAHRSTLRGVEEGVGFGDEEELRSLIGWNLQLPWYLELARSSANAKIHESLQWKHKLTFLWALHGKTAR